MKSDIKHVKVVNYSVLMHEERGHSVQAGPSP